MPTENYDAQAQALVNATQNIIAAIKEHGQGTVLMMVLFTELIKVTQVTGDFMSLPQTERDEFLGAIWDAGIGNESNALVTKVGIFQGEVLEQLSDAMKTAALAYFNRELTA